MDITGLDAIKDLPSFDDRFSAPIHGFKDAQAFYEYCNPLPFVSQIQRPLLILNALNDPLLEGDCYPYSLCEKSPNLYLETPKRGGHVGFIQAKSEFTYSEQRALDFLKDV